MGSIRVRVFGQFFLCFLNGPCDPISKHGYISFGNWSVTHNYQLYVTFHVYVYWSCVGVLVKNVDE